MGLSPRLRGNRLVVGNNWSIGRSIPAPAGEPVTAVCCPTTTAVYPRACGGTDRLWASRSSCTGLSPRLRGNPEQVLLPVFAEGSIPAPAGEPPPGTLTDSSRGVYPRACGGTF